MIGVFDSGFGGLSILKEIKKKLPQYDYMYLGDTARAPYGNRSLHTVRKFTREGVEFLFKQGCTLVILACNTASADALRSIQQQYLHTHPERKVLGVIIPAVEESVSKTTHKRIGVIGTKAAITSGTFLREIKKEDSSITVFQKSCPLLVPLVEKGEHASSKTKKILKHYLQPLLHKNIDTLILGCTHYEHLEKEIRSVVGKKVILITEGKVIARKLSQYLKRHPEVEKPLHKKKKLIVYTTGSTEKFKKLGSLFLGTAIKPIQVRMLK